MKDYHFAVSANASIVALAILASTVAAQGTESLGDQLLDGLSPGVIEESEAQGRIENPKSNDSDLGPDLNFRMPTRLDHWNREHGDAPASAPLPLVRARDGMREATALLSKSQTVAQARVPQQRVIAQLDELIAELSRQCQGSGGQSSEQARGANLGKQAADSRASRKVIQGTTAARDSSDRTQSNQSRQVERRDIDDMVKQLWGHLPERARQQMLQSFTGEFLPEYELEIEKYYQRLAEEESRDSTR